MVLLGDEPQVDAYLGPFGGSSNLDAKIGARFVPNIPQDQKSFWTHKIELLSDVGHMESHFGSFRDSVSIGAR
jgi:hypothetical protein